MDITNSSDRMDATLYCANEFIFTRLRYHKAFYRWRVAYLSYTPYFRNFVFFHLQVIVTRVLELLLHFHLLQLAVITWI
jgi:hypothetical protein